jgi:hypothetical protein
VQGIDEVRSGLCLKIGRKARGVRKERTVQSSPRSVFERQWYLGTDTSQDITEQANDGNNSSVSRYVGQSRIRENSMIYQSNRGRSRPRLFTSKRPRLAHVSLCIVSFPFGSHFSSAANIREIHHSSSMNSTITVPFFNPASAMGTSSISRRFLPMLMSSKDLPSLPSKGDAFSHS